VTNPEPIVADHSPPVRCPKGGNRLRRLREAAGLDGTLSRYGVHRTDLHDLAEAALTDPCVVTNPRRPSRRDIEVIYEQSL